MTAANERRILMRAVDPVSAAAIKIHALKVALSIAADQGERSERRASGDCTCAICGDELRHHCHEPSGVFVVACTGVRFKL